jgi:hypothetical protein
MRRVGLLASTPRCVSLLPCLTPLVFYHRSYATGHQGTRSGAKGRRYYTDPLRTPQSGVRTVVGRQNHPTTAMSSLPPNNAAGAVTVGERPQRHNAEKEDMATKCLTTCAHRKDQLMAILTAHGRTVRYDKAGVPVEGSWYLLPWHEQLRILAAIVGALCITKAFFDVVRFELLYYGVWKLGYRNDDSFTKRVLYYGSTALLATGLFFSFNLNFFLSAWLVGRREIAAHMVYNGFSYIVPHRAIQLLERRLKLSFV